MATSCKRIPPGYYGVGGTPATRTAVEQCGAGYACPGSAGGRIRCDGVSTWQDALNATECKPVSLCAAGEFASEDVSATSDR